MSRGLREVRQFKLNFWWILGLAATPSLLLLAWTWLFPEAPKPVAPKQTQETALLRPSQIPQIEQPVSVLARLKQESRRSWARRLATQHPPFINKAFMNRLQDVDVMADIFYTSNDRPAIAKLDHELVFCFNRDLQDAEWNNRKEEGSVYGVTYAFGFKDGSREQWDFAPHRLQDIPLGEISQYTGPRCFGISEWFWHPTNRGYEQDVNKAFDRKFRVGNVSSFEVTLYHQACPENEEICLEWKELSRSVFKPFPKPSIVANKSVSTN